MRKYIPIGSAYILVSYINKSIYIREIPFNSFGKTKSYKMDPNWFKTELPKDCYQCILCHAVIPVKNKKKDRFEKHLKTDHGIFYNRNLILVICFLGRIQFFKLIDSIKSEKQTREIAVQTERNTTLDAMMQTDAVETEDTEAAQVTTQTLMDQIDKLTNVLKLNGEQDAQAMDELLIRDQETPTPPSESEDSDVFDDSSSVASNTEFELDESIRQQEEASMSKINQTDQDQNESLGSPSKKMKVSHDTSEMIIDFITKESDYFKEKPKEISNSTEARALKFTETDPSLPDGWRARAFVRKRGRVDYEYLSPELKVFRSKVGVVEYMKAMGGYTDIEMDRVCPGIRIKKEKV